MVRAAALIALALASSGDDRWIELPSTAQDNIYLDARSMPAERGRDAEPWLKFVHKGKSKDGAASALWHYAVRCSDRKIATIDHVKVYADGAATRDGTDQRAPVYEDAVPNSFGEYLASLICGEK